mgnify:FL=1
MAKIFYPSCKIKADFPEESEKVRLYLEKRYGVTTAGCCRPHHVHLTNADHAVVICNNCAAIVEESSMAGAFTYVWELINRDEDFPFPDYGGARMTVQDCWAAVERRDMQEAIRALLRKMNINIIEQEENFDQTRFHGLPLLQPCVPGNAKLAPRRYENGKSPMFTPMSEEQQRIYLVNHAEKLPEKTAVCSCKYCRDGIQAGGKEGVHILQLLFPKRTGGLI